MDSTRLAGRKEVLIYILVKCFQIRGKCVSEIKVSSNGIISVDSSTLEFTTKSKVGDIGAFVKYKLQEISAENSSSSPSCIAGDFSSNPYLRSIKISIESDEYPLVSDIEQVMKPMHQLIEKPACE